MRQVDLTRRKRVPVLLDMVRSIKDARDPRAVMELFIHVVQQAFEPACYLALSTTGLDTGAYRIARWRTADGVEHAPQADLGHAALAQPVRRGGLLAGLTACDSPTLLHDFSAPSDPVFGDRLAGYQCVAAVPVFEADDSLDWVVLFHASPRGFNEDDVEALMALANLTSAAVNFAHLHQRAEQASQRVHREVDMIAEIQKVLLPKTPPAVPGLSLATSYKSFDRAGGDYFDVFELRRLPGADQDDVRWLILIADSAGHGPAAAVMMTVINAVLFTYPHTPASPGAVLSYLNHHLHERHQAASMVTAILGFYEPATGRLVYANAGHNPPLIRRPGPPVLVEDVPLGSGLPLGILPSHDSNDAELTLQPGETLLFYTDGVPDERDEANEPFGMERISAVLTSTGDPQEVVDQLNAELIRHQGTTMPEDDQTMVVVRREQNRAKR